MTTRAISAGAIATGAVTTGAIKSSETTLCISDLQLQKGWLTCCEGVVGVGRDRSNGSDLEVVNLRQIGIDRCASCGRNGITGNGKGESAGVNAAKSCRGFSSITPDEIVFRPVVVAGKRLIISGSISYRKTCQLVGALFCIVG